MRAAMLSLLCTLLPAQASDLDTRVSEALARARPGLLGHLRLQHAGVLALCCLAAVHDGIPADEPVFAAAIERLSRTTLEGTYDLALRLMVMAEHPAFPRREQLAPRDTKELLRRQRRGGFGYRQPQRDWDLSNTQYAALGLRAAAALGQRIPEEVWLDLAIAVRNAQARDGGFGYTPEGRRQQPYSSMTVAGIAVLRICQDQLGAAAPQSLTPAVARAWDWMRLHEADIGSLATKSAFYFHYGLERAAILCDVQQVGGRAWYDTGAEMLLGCQLRNGAWSSAMEFRPGALGGEGSPVDTAFAVLFLRRKFQKLLGPLTGPRGLQELGDQATEAEIAHAVLGLERRGGAAIPDVLKALRSNTVARRRAAARALEALSGRDFGYDPDRLEASADAIKAAELWWLTKKRK